MRHWLSAQTQCENSWREPHFSGQGIQQHLKAVSVQHRTLGEPAWCSQEQGIPSHLPQLGVMRWKSQLWEVRNTSAPQAGTRSAAVESPVWWGHHFRAQSWHHRGQSPQRLTVQSRCYHRARTLHSSRRCPGAALGH